MEAGAGKKNPIPLLRRIWIFLTVELRSQLV
jgi:hypothetical protein